MVRTYLKSLDDRRGAKRGLPGFANEYSTPLTSLRSFRDGKDNALAGSLVTTFAKLLGSDAQLDGFSGDPDYATDTDLRKLFAEDPHREQRLRQYDMIDETRGEAESALHAWADLGITGGGGDAGSRQRPPYVPEYLGKDARIKGILKEIGEHINMRLMPQSVKLQVFRGMCKYGDQWGEVGLAERDGEMAITQIAPRHARTMRLYRDTDGNIDPNQMFCQILPGQTKPTANHIFPTWKIARFSNMVQWGDDYGRSIFHSSLRAHIQLEAMEVAMIIRRLTRAPLRYHRILDVGHVDPNQVFNEVERYKKANRKVRVVDSRGRQNQMTIALPPEEDLYTGKRDKDSPADVQVLQGDASIAEIADVIHFFNKWLAGLGPPKAHLGYEADTMRSTITDLHIVFARKVRRMQMKFLQGLNHLYYVSLILKGIDPTTVQYRIVPPSLGTRDELVRAQVMQAYATTTQYLATAFAMTGKSPSPAWFLKNILGMPEDAIEALDLQAVVQKMGKKGKNDPASGLASSELAMAALDDDSVAKEVAMASFLLGERAIDRGVEGVFGSEIHPYDQCNLRPFGNVAAHEVARQLGVLHLERAA